MVAWSTWSYGLLMIRWFSWIFGERKLARCCLLFFSTPNINCLFYILGVIIVSLKSEDYRDIVPMISTTAQLVEIVSQCRRGWSCCVGKANLPLSVRLNCLCRWGKYHYVDEANSSVLAKLSSVASARLFSAMPAM